jgi:hypothetical protein
MTNMTPRTSTSALFPIFSPILASALMAYAAVEVTLFASQARAEPTSPPTAASTVAQPRKAEKPEKKGKRAPGRAAASKAGSAARGAKRAKTPTPPVATAESSDKSTSSARPSQVMRFDTDQVDGQRLEPGFELIEGAPAKARHGSLVEPLKPGDSVVGRE